MTPRRTPEQELVNQFISHIQQCSDTHVALDTQRLINSNCKAKQLADIEYFSKDGTHWVIEAKSNDSADKHNTVHKIFGELLKETGRSGRDAPNYAILIPESAVDFYSRAFQKIAREKFIAFGSLIPVTQVFLCSEQRASWITWTQLYDACKR